MRCVECKIHQGLGLGRIFGASTFADRDESGDLPAKDLIAFIDVEWRVIQDEHIRVIDAACDLLPVLLRRLAAIALVVSEKFLLRFVDGLVSAIPLVCIGI